MKPQKSATGLVLIVVLFAVSCALAEIKIVPSEKDKRVDILYDGKLFTSYIYPADLEKPVLYPIYTPKGTLVTRGFPRDPRPG